MAIAGALVVPVDQQQGALLRQRLAALAGVEVQAVGPKGIAVVLEGTDSKRLEELSRLVAGWPEVLDFQLGYLNWEEDETDPGPGGGDGCGLP